MAEKKAKGDGPFAFVMPMIKMIIALAIGLLGCFLFGILGSMTYPGIGAIAGAALGFLLFGLIGCCALGVYKDVMPKAETFDISQAAPSFVTQAMGKHGNFTLIVTVHKATDVSVQKGLNPFASPDLYVIIESGTNPPKATCVKRSSHPEFNEQFKMMITPSDKAIVVKLMDQDMLGAEQVGYVSVDIDQDIIAMGFPQNHSYILQTGAKGAKAAGKTQLFLSFDYTDDFPRGHAKQLRMENVGNNFEARKQRILESEAQWQSQNYGSCEHLNHMQFNTRYDHSVQDRRRGAGETMATNV